MMDDDEKEMMQRFSDKDDERNRKAIEDRKKKERSPSEILEDVKRDSYKVSDAIKKAYRDHDQERRDAYFKKHGSS